AESYATSRRKATGTRLRGSRRAFQAGRSFGTRLSTWLSRCRALARASGQRLRRLFCEQEEAVMQRVDEVDGQAEYVVEAEPGGLFPLLRPKSDRWSSGACGPAKGPTGGAPDRFSRHGRLGGGS